MRGVESMGKLNGESIIRENPPRTSATRRDEEEDDRAAVLPVVVSVTCGLWALVGYICMCCPASS